MGKRIKPPTMEVELKQRLDTLGNENRILQKSMDQILDLLKGSSIMNTPGLIKTFQQFEIKLEETSKKMDYFERWWELQKQKKGTFTIRTANLLTKGLAIIGGLGAAAGVVYTIIQIIEHLRKL
jgi:hypothetical protein